VNGKEREGKIHRRLKVWQRSMDLVVEVYRKLKTLPPQERFNLAEQMRRSVISVPSNIAEGAARTSPREKLQFWSVARGSLSELDTELEIALSLGYLDKRGYDGLADILDEVDRMLSGLMRSKRTEVRSEE
jgi:four helix bundle protein